MSHQEKESKYIFTSTLQILILTSSIFKCNFFDFLLNLEDLGVDNMGNDLYVMKDMKYLVNEFITEQENEDKLTNEMVDLVLEALGVDSMENA